MGWWDGHARGWRVRGLLCGGSGLVCGGVGRRERL